MHLGQVGERFRIIAQKGRRAQCPTGTQQESSGRLGTGQEYAWCYRAPVFAPPPVTTTTISPQIVTRVPTTVTTAVSPQIAPTLAQQMASPGAQVAAAPQQVAPLQTGITEQQLRDILTAEATKAAAERDYERRRRDIADAQRLEDERYAREQAEAAAAAAAEVYTVPGGPPMALAPPPMPMLAVPEMGPPPDEAPPVAIAEAKAELPMGLLLLAAAAIGAVVLMGGKGKRKRAKK